MRSRAATAIALLALGGALCLEGAGAISASARPALPAPAERRGLTTRVSVDNQGRQSPDGQNFAPAISANGRWVAFDSDADTFVPGDTNERTDVFVRDTKTGRTERVSVSSGGAQGDDHSWTPQISADGRWVAFVSDATNLVPGDTNRFRGEELGTDVFLHDRRTHRTTRLNLAIDGRQTEGGNSPMLSADGHYVVYNAAKPLVSTGTDEDLEGMFVYNTRTGKRERLPNIVGDDPSISADGRYVVFASEVRDLVPNDTNRKYDCFLYDRKTHKTTLISVNDKGRQGNNESNGVVISPNGRYVAFSSTASNLVPGDTNKLDDVFVRDLKTGRTTRISLTATGRQARGRSGGPVLSGDGRYVVYLSEADIVGRGVLDPAVYDVFLYDRRTRTVSRVNIAPNGAGANGDTTSFPAISSDGRHVAFASRASNLVPGDTNLRDDVFVRSYG
jgi:Tol biopolymer transport system component